MTLSDLKQAIQEAMLIPSQASVEPSDESKATLQALSDGLAEAISDWSGDYGPNIELISQSDHGFVVGDLVRYDADTEIYVLASSNSSEEAVIAGIVREVQSTDIFQLCYSAAEVSNISETLVPGQLHYLSETGKLVDDSDQPVIKPIFIAITDSRGYFINSLLSKSDAVADVFTALSDTPDSYEDNAGKSIRVNPEETGLEFYDSTGTDEKVKISSGDDSAQYLEDKLESGTGIALSTQTSSGIQTIEVINSDTGTAAVLAHTSVYDHSLLHSPVSVYGAPLTISGQQLRFNYDSDDFELDGNNLKLKAGGNVSGSGVTNRITEWSGSSTVSYVSDLTTYIGGTANQVVVVDDGDGTLTLSLPQDIAISSSPTFSGLTLNGILDMSDNSISNVDTISFNTSSTTTPTEGQLNWNSDYGTLQVGMPGGDVVLQPGQEVVLAKNVSGSGTTNGKAFYISGATGAVPEADFANASEEEACKTLALAMKDIENNQQGYFTTFGFVRELDTSFGEEGDEVFLDSTDGGLTTTKLSHPFCRVKIGYIIRKHATEGVIFVNIRNIDYLQPMQSQQEPTGFDENKETLRGDISFSDATRTFTIDKQAGEDFFNFWVWGTEFRKTSAETLTITADNGVHVLYFDEDGAFQEAVNPSTSTMASIIRDYALVSILYWNNTLGEAIYVGEERHQNQMDGATHTYLHYVRGLAYNSGLGLNTFSVDGAGATEDAQFGVDAGVVSDEDLVSHIAEIASTTGLPVYYMTGASGAELWNRETYAGFSALTQDGTSGTNIAYNELTGGVWQKSEVSNNDYVLYHIFATTEKDNPIISIMGQDTYNTKPAAQEAAGIELRSIILNEDLTPEIRALGTVIFQAKDSYANDLNAIVVSTADGDNYVDWRSQEISRTVVSTSEHNNLSGLQGGNTNEYYHLTNDEYTGLSGLSNTRIVKSDAGGNLASVSDLTNWIAGTTNQVTVTDDGDGTLTLSLPQDMHTGASPQFEGMTLSNADATTSLNIYNSGTDNPEINMSVDGGTTAWTVEIDDADADSFKINGPSGSNFFKLQPTLFSVAFMGCAASGVTAFATGQNTTASGKYATSFGRDTLASGEGSASFGYETIASGQFASAYGNKSESLDTYCFASGFNAEADGTSAHALGYLVNATGEYSFCFGRVNTSSGTSSMVCGGQENTASGSMSFATGRANNVDGAYSSGFGYRGTVNGNYSTLFNLTATANTVTAANVFCVMGAKLAVGTVSPSYTQEIYQAGGGIASRIRTGGDKCTLRLQDNDTSTYLSAKDGLLSLGGTSVNLTQNVNIVGSTGFTGFGVIDPAQHIEIEDDSATLTALQISNAGGGDTAVIFADNGTADAYFGVDETDGFLKVGSTSLTTNTTMTWDIGNQRVGIGESTPGTLIDAASTAPYLTLHNTTEEDANGGRESKIIFEGEDSSGDIITQAEIEVSLKASGSGPTNRSAFQIKTLTKDDVLKNALTLGYGYASDGGLPEILFVNFTNNTFVPEYQSVDGWSSPPDAIIEGDLSVSQLSFYGGSDISGEKKKMLFLEAATESGSTTARTQIAELWGRPIASTANGASGQIGITANAFVLGSGGDDCTLTINAAREVGEGEEAYTQRDYVASSSAMKIGGFSVPSQLLHVRDDDPALTAIQVDNANSADAGLILSDNDTEEWRIYLDNDDSDKLKFMSDGSTDKMVLDQSGRVGIGTTSPSVTLDVDGRIKTNNNEISIGTGNLRGEDTGNIADDDVYSFDATGVRIGGIIFGPYLDAYKDEAQGFILFRCPATSFTQIVTASADVDIRTGVLDGTTGTDGKLTISAHTDNKIYIENRLGGNRRLWFNVFGL